MNYNTQLQNINLDLQSLLTKASKLGQDDSVMVETWTVTDKEGNTTEENIETVKIYDITIDMGIPSTAYTMTNNATTIRHGETYENIIQIIDESYLPREVEVWWKNPNSSSGGSVGEGSYWEWYEIEKIDDVAHIYIPNIQGYIKIETVVY